MDGSLKKFLFEENLTVKAFASMIGVSASFVYHLLNKKRVPSPDLAHKIEKLTQGRVSRDELLFLKEPAAHTPLRDSVKEKLEQHEKRITEIERVLFKKGEKSTST